MNLVPAILFFIMFIFWIWFARKERYVWLLIMGLVICVWGFIHRANQIGWIFLK